MHILRGMGWKFCVKFQIRTFEISNKNFKPYTAKFVFFDLRLNNGWINNRDIGDLDTITPIMTSL